MRSMNMEFNSRIFFTLFPKGYWILVAIGTGLSFLSETSQLGNVLINFGSFLIAFKAAVIIHETGHLIAAKLVGGVPRRMVLGKGHELYRMKAFDIIVIINSNFLGGYAYASIDRPKFIKLRYAFFTLGGILLNVLVALAFYALFDLGFNNSNDEISIAIPFTIFLANALMIINFIPYYTTVLGMKVPTDGLSLLKLPFTKIKDVEKRLDDNLLFDGHEYLEKKEYQSAWNVFTNYFNKYRESKIISLSLSYILLKTGQPEKSIEESLKLLDVINDKETRPFVGIIYNQLAWTYLVLNDIEKADHFSALAIKTIPNENSIRGTRGSVLVEKGLTSEGMTLLFPNMDFQFVNNATLATSIYLMLAYHLKGELSESSKYLEFVKANSEKLEADEKILFERNLLKMNAQEEAVK